VKNTKVAVRDHHPLKQGLRQGLANHRLGCLAVRDHHPLKQGFGHALAENRSTFKPALLMK